MAAGFRQLNLESPQSDTYPLLMDGNSLPNHEHVLTIPPRMSEGLDERAGLPSSTQSDTAISLGSTSAVSQPQITPLAGSLGRSGSLRWRRNANNYGAHQRASPLNSGLWISIELTVTMSQVIASIIVLSLSRDEKPKAPLSVWVVGYATGCLATVPLLYWRYTYHFAHQSNQNALDSGPSHSIPPRSSQTSFALPQRTVSQSEEADGIASTPGQNRISVVGDSRYMAAKSDTDHYAREKKREMEEIVEMPDTEAAEVGDVFAKFGLQPSEYSPLVENLRSRPDDWVEFMMRFELGLEKPDPTRAVKSAVTIAVSYIVGGLIPLFPYMGASDVRHALFISIGITVVALFLFGFVKGNLTGIKPWKSAVQTVVVGVMASAAAFGLARAIQAIHRPN